MTDQKYSTSLSINPTAMRRYKQYTRNGKTFWRDYKRSVNGGVTMGIIYLTHTTLYVACVKYIIPVTIFEKIDMNGENLYLSNKSGVEE